MNKTEKTLMWLGAGALAVSAGRAVARRARTIELRRKVVLITGGSRGLGLEMARQLAIEEGARVAICARDEDELKRAQSQLAHAGAHVEIFVCDVGEQAQCERAVADVAAKLGPIDVLINNAASMQIGPMELMTTSDYDRSMRDHFWGPLYLTLAVLPAMRAQGGGRVVNISSFAGKVAPPHMMPYVASKHALAGLGKALRAEVSKDGVYVSTIYPTLMRTGSLLHATFKGDNKTEYAMGAMMSSNPMFSMSASRAAREIIECCKRGDAEAVLSRRAQLGTAFGVLFPGMTQDLLALLTRVLPQGKGAGATLKPKRGMESFSSAAPSVLTTPNDNAAKTFNETWPGPEK